MINRVKNWFGLGSRPNPAPPLEPQTEKAMQIWQTCQAVDNVYGVGFARRNPRIVAQFMQALAAQTQAEAARDQAAEIATLREILASGAGGLTIGLEK